MKYKWIKDIQRKVNKTIRNANESIQKDDLWKGRFFIRQLQAYYDCQCECLHINIVIIDRKTGQYKTQYFYTIFKSGMMFLNWQLFLFINNFIVEDCAVWQKDEPTKDKTVYTNLKYNDERLIDNVVNHKV